MYHLFLLIKTLHSAHRIYLYAPYGPHNKQCMFLQTTLTGWSLLKRRNVFPVRYGLYLCVPYGSHKDTSTKIPASRKRRRKGNPVVSDETVIYGYESSVTLATDRLHYKSQIHPLVREGAQRRGAKQFSGKRKEKVKSDHGPQRGARHKDILTD
jgi:hypothetical protein